MERCLACEAVVSRANDVSSLVRTGALCRVGREVVSRTDVNLHARKSADRRQVWVVMFLVLHGLASEAALHDWLLVMREALGVKRQRAVPGLPNFLQDIVTDFHRGLAGVDLGDEPFKIFEDRFRLFFVQL